MKELYSAILIKKHKLLSIAITVGILLFFPCRGFSKEKSVIVGFHKKPGLSEKALIHGARGVIKHAYHLIPAMAVSLSEKEIEKLKKNKKVAYVEDDGIVTAADEYTAAWGVGHISSEIAHAGGNKGAGIKIAVLDTGIDNASEELNDNFVDGINFVQTQKGVPADPLAFYDDNWQSHGTHVAGIIAAEENGIGVIGVAPEASLYAVRVLDGAGFGYISWLIAGLQWAVDNGMDIVNLSLQADNSTALHDACNSTYQAGVLLVAAGGNYFAGGGPVKYPAAYESVIAVTATTDADDLPAWFSPVGPEVELAAPGVDILSTVTEANGSYDTLSGTSQASPHVAGAAALFLATGPQDENGNGRINDEVRELLRTTAIDLGVAGVDNSTGYGLVNAAAAAFDPTLINLSSFSARPGNGNVTLFWETESEIENAGFNIYRSESEDGDYEQINSSLVPAEGTATEGAVYELFDEDVENRTKYWYMLEDIDLNGVSAIHGPVSSTPRLIHGLKNGYGLWLVNAAAASSACPDVENDSYAICDGICDPGSLNCGDCDDSNESINP